MTVEYFCDKYGACAEGREWAIGTGQSMEEIWERDDLKVEWRIWIATRHGVLDDRALRLFACWCVRQVWHILMDDRSKNAVIVAERYANGDATKDELAAAWAAAKDAAWDAARAAAKDAAWDAARAAAKDAAWYAAWDAARDAAWDAARAAAWDAARAAAKDAAWYAAWHAAWDAQSRWLVENAKPDFD